MSRPLLIRCRLRAFVLERCKHWHIERQRVPQVVLDTLADDFMKQVDVRICALLTKPDPTPRPPRPRKAKVFKCDFKNQPTLL